MPREAAKLSIATLEQLEAVELRHETSHFVHLRQDTGAVILGFVSLDPVRNCGFFQADDCGEVRSSILGS